MCSRCCERLFTTPISFYLIVNFLNVVVFCLNEIDFNFLSAKLKTNFSYSAAWLKDIPVKEGDRVSVYISHPVPENIIKTLNLNLKRLSAFIGRTFRARHYSMNNSKVLNSLSQNLQLRNQNVLSAKESWSGGN